MRNGKSRALLITGSAAMLAFVLWTAAVSCIDVRAIGPLGSRVGFAALNRAVHAMTGVHMALYTVTDWLGMIPLAAAAVFAAVGAAQMIKRRSILKVDADILLLGIFYAAVLAVYLLFEAHPVNYRPVLIDGRLEASYPSSTTLLTMCVVPTTAVQLNARVKNRALSRVLTWLLGTFTAMMVAARLLSGVHWVTDIIGGVLASAGLVLLYCGAAYGASARRSTTE